MSVISEFDENYQSASLDEAYLNITKYILEKHSEDYECHEALSERTWAVGSKIVSELRQKIFERTKLTCSAGIAPNKMLAKVCSDLDKPNGQFLLKATCVEAVRKFLDETRVRKIPGIGPVHEQFLKALGIVTCTHLYESMHLINLLMTPSLIEFYLRVSIGVSSNQLPGPDEYNRKSLGAETTFASTNDINLISSHLEKLSEEVSQDLQKRNLYGKTITLRVKWGLIRFNRQEQKHSKVYQ